MDAITRRTVDDSTADRTFSIGAAARRRSVSDVRPRRTAQTMLRFADWRGRSRKWGWLMVAAQRGENQAYERLLRELDGWLRGYYARRLPRAAAEDARQDVLLAIHTKRHTYASSKPFGPWVAAIAHYKWIDHIRDAARFSALPLPDNIPIDDGGEATISAIVVDDLLKRLKPAQARVIRLVKLQGFSIERASIATGQSAALVKVNIHRGLKKLAALVASDDITAATGGSSLERRSSSSNHERANNCPPICPAMPMQRNEETLGGEEPRFATIAVNP
jgi:RNA polymerase sigma factor (sigma-70 family)